MSEDRGTPDRPLFMALIPPEIKTRQFVVNIALTAIPVAIALVMQKPALRQAIVMRSTHEAKRFCQGMADFWQDMALRAGTAYQKARF